MAVRHNISMFGTFANIFSEISTSCCCSALALDMGHPPIFVVVSHVSVPQPPCPRHLRERLGSAGASPAFAEARLASLPFVNTDGIGTKARAEFRPSGN